jgi:hypothetical protein
MKKWEYHMFSYSLPYSTWSGHHISGLWEENDWGELGENGWELVSCINLFTNGTTFLFIFKRPLEKLKEEV